MGTIQKPNNSPLNILLEKQSYANILYHLISFPCSLLFFILTIVGIVVGIATSIIWIGIPILIGMMALWWQFASFDRFMAQSLLGVSIPPMDHPSPVSRSGWQKIQAQIRDPMTWKTLSYLLLKFPLATLCFSLTLSLFVATIAVGLLGLVISLLISPFVALAYALQEEPAAKGKLKSFFLLGMAGFGLGLMTIFLLNLLATVEGMLARSFLGLSDSAFRLKEAEAKAAEERIRADQAEQRRRQLVVNVSHELRAPVANISGHLESLLISTDEGTIAPDPQTLHNYLNTAHQEARRLGILVDELLSLARMESGELRVDIKEVSARDAVEEVYKSLKPLAMQQRQITLVRGSSLNLPYVLADYNRLVQILLNLARNAISYTPSGGIVSITLERSADGRHLALTVEDSGIGIPAEDLPHIFERFYRVDPSRTRNSGGFGLGLAIVQDFVTAMGGSIMAESEEGKGSRFTVLLRPATAIELTNQ